MYSKCQKFISGLILVLTRAVETAAQSLELYRFRFNDKCAHIISGLKINGWLRFVSKVRNFEKIFAFMSEKEKEYSVQLMYYFF